MPLPSRYQRLFAVEQKTVVITGGSSGLGLSMARAYVECGARVHIVGRDTGALEAARRELGDPGQVVTVAADIATPAGIAVLADALAGEPSVHVLINNAGMTWGDSFENFPTRAWDDVMSLNVKAPFVLVQALLGKLQAAATDDDPARVINIGSVYGETTQVMRAWSYAASKAALHHLTRVMALELADRRILVNAIAPGFFESKMTRFISSDAKRLEAVRSGIPLGRTGLPDDIGALSLFLGSRASSYMTGNVMLLDGGLLARA